MRHALIMAGGSGTRLWPLSRRRRPKQLLRLFGGASLLQLAYRRLAGLFDPQQVWVVTSAAYLDQVAAELPDVPPDHLIGEPAGRDTANAIGLAAELLARRDADATMAVFTADHLIAPQDAFAAAIRRGCEAAERYPTALVTFGIRPTHAATGYGYIRLGAAVDAGVHRVAEFREKPGREAAEGYLRSGEYVWNSGMFAWRLDAIRAELARSLPENATRLARLAAGWETTEAAARAAEFERLPRISIDYGVLEKAREMLVVPMDCDWRDVGSWAAVADALPAGPDANVTAAERVLAVDSHGNLVVAEDGHLIALVGVRDLVVVRTEDATLICHRDEVERVRDLAVERGRRFGYQYE